MEKSLNEKRYEKILELDEIIRDEVIKSSLKSFPVKLSEIYNALINSDADEIARHAHALKGAIGYFDAKYAYSLASELEMMARENRTGESLPVFYKLKASLEDMMEFFESPDWEQRLKA